MEALERDYRFSQDQFGENALHLNATQRHVKRLLENAKVRKFLGSRYSKMLEEFQAPAVLGATCYNVRRPKLNRVDFRRIPADGYCVPDRDH